MWNRMLVFLIKSPASYHETQWNEWWPRRKWTHYILTTICRTPDSNLESFLVEATTVQAFRCLTSKVLSSYYNLLLLAAVSAVLEIPLLHAVAYALDNITINNIHINKQLVPGTANLALCPATWQIQWRDPRPYVRVFWKFHDDKQ